MWLVLLSGYQHGLQDFKEDACTALARDRRACPHVAIQAVPVQKQEGRGEKGGTLESGVAHEAGSRAASGHGAAGGRAAEGCTQRSSLAGESRAGGRGALDGRKRGEVAVAKRASLFTSPLFDSEGAPSSQAESARRAQQYQDASQCLPAVSGEARSSQSGDWQLNAAWLLTVNRLTDPREAK